MRRSKATRSSRGKSAWSPCRRRLGTSGSNIVAGSRGILAWASSGSLIEKPAWLATLRVRGQVRKALTKCGLADSWCRQDETSHRAESLDDRLVLGLRLGRARGFLAVKCTRGKVGHA